MPGAGRGNGSEAPPRGPVPSGSGGNACRGGGRGVGRKVREGPAGHQPRRLKPTNQSGACGGRRLGGEGPRGFGLGKKTEDIHRCRLLWVCMPKGWELGEMRGSRKHHEGRNVSR